MAQNAEDRSGRFIGKSSRRRHGVAIAIGLGQGTTFTP